MKGDALLVWEESVDNGTGIANYEVYVDDQKALTVKATPSVAVDNIAKGSLVRTSSTNGDMSGSKAVDGDENTRWQANQSDRNGDWIELELNDYYILNEVNLKWENAYAKKYNIQTSLDGEHWDTVFTENNSDGGTDNIGNLKSACRYVKINCTERAMDYGSSLFEIALKGQNTVSATLSYPNGTYKWTVKATDYAGNVTNASATYNFTIVDSSTTAISSATADDSQVKFVFDGNTIYLQGAPANTPYQIFNVFGAKISEGHGNVIRVNHPAGIYLLSAAGQTLKYVVK